MSNIPTIYAKNQSALAVSRSLRVTIKAEQGSSNAQSHVQGHIVNAHTDNIGAENRVAQTLQTDSQEKLQTGRRLSSRRQEPGIHVSLSTQNSQVSIDAYRSLRSDGRRKVHVQSQPKEEITQKKLNTSVNSFADQTANASRKPGPQSRVVLENFIEQMMGIKTPPVPGANINVSI